MRNLAGPEFCNHTIPAGRERSREYVASCLGLKDGILTLISSRENSMHRGRQAKQAMTIHKPKTEGTDPKGPELNAPTCSSWRWFHQHHIIQFYFTRQWRTAWWFGLGSGRTKATWALDRSFLCPLLPSPVSPFILVSLFIKVKNTLKQVGAGKSAV